MDQILVGTASWADKSLLDSGLFYPKVAKTAEARLRYYSTHFRLVEVDARTTLCPPRKSGGYPVTKVTFQIRERKELAPIYVSRHGEVVF